jgi:arabinose-5-phosphate isomerase
MTEIQHRAKQIFEAEAAAIRAIRLNPAFDDAVRAIEACRGKVIITGMGKAGFTAQRFAAVLCSTGTPVCIRARLLTAT